MMPRCGFGVHSRSVANREGVAKGHTMTTKFLAKLMGLWLVLTVLGMFAQRQTSIDTIGALFTDPPLLWITGVFTLLIGLAVLLAHTRWSGGATSVIVTFYGWVATIKGLLFLWLPPPMRAASFRALQFDRFFYAYLAVALVLGGY
jgi:hypothetical protein